MSDRLAAVFSLLLFIAFVGAFALIIAEPPLTIVIVLVILMAAYDFWNSPQG
jgi:hypothetical protein